MSSECPKDSAPCRVGEFRCAPNSRILMTICRITLLFCLLLPGLGRERARAQNTSELERIQAAMAAGDAEGVLSGAEDRVDIALLGQGRLYNRAQAIFVMKDFFRSYPPKSYTIRNEEREAANWFAIGRYTNRYDGAEFSVYLRLRLRSSSWRLAAIRVSNATGR